MGFIKYNGMTAEQFVWAWLKSEFLMPKKLMFLPDNLYYETVKPTIEAYGKRVDDSTEKAERQDTETKENEKEKSETQQGGKQC